jgi:transposase
MERAVAFILEQQAQSAASQQQHEEAMRRIEAAQEVTAQQVQHLSGAMIELAEAQARTGARLDALINTVERHISEGPHGQS